MNKEFQVHMLNDQGKSKAMAIAEAFDRCLEELLRLCPPGRELSIVRTKMEEAAFFAKKAMAVVNVAGPDPAVCATCPLPSGHEGKCA